MIKRYFKGKGAYAFSLIMGMLFVFICKTGSELASKGDITWSGTYIWVTLGISLVAGTLMGTLCFIGMNLICDHLPEQSQGPELSWGWVWLISLSLLVISRVPGWLAYWPGIASYDSPVQLGQVLGGGYNEHHPLAHTLLIKGCIAVGNTIWGSNNAGIAVYTFVQIILISGAMAFGITTVARCFPCVKGRAVAGICQLLFMLFPFNLYLDISVTKDITFTAFFMVAVVSLGMIIKGYKEPLYCVLLFIGVLGSVLFRSNGLYAWAAAWVIMFVVWCVGRFNRSIGRPVVVVVVAMILGRLILSLLFSGLGAVQGDRREMLSVPIQQMARTAYYHAGDISSEDMAVVDEFLLDESYMEYQASLSDPVKRHTNTYEVRYRTGEFVRTYLHLLREYPGDYINAVLALDAGYIYPGDVSHAFINVKEGSHGLGYVQTCLSAELEDTGIGYAPMLQGMHEAMEKWADDNAYLGIPLLRVVFMPGIYVWLYVLLILGVMIRKQWRDLMTLLPLAAYYGTLLLGPGVQLRYIYPLMVILPIITCVIIRREHDRT